jgi:hypothetical protein
MRDDSVGDPRLIAWPWMCCPTQGSEWWFVVCDQWLIGGDEGICDAMFQSRRWDELRLCWDQRQL